MRSEKERYQGLIDVLIPVAKGYITDRAFEVCSRASRCSADTALQ